MWPRLLTIFLVFVLMMPLGLPFHSHEEIFAEEGAEDPCILCDLAEMGSDDLSEIMANLIRPLASTVSSIVSPFDDELYVTKDLRVIIFSPHPDDESLAAAGLIHRVVSNGGEVRVVFVTNGDGYPEAVRRQLGHLPRSSHDFIDYGRHRYQEGLQALCELGVPPEDAISLGFPDDGIDDLLKEHYSPLTPYTSPYTRFSCAGYKESFNRWVVYAGVNLKDEIAKILTDFSPDWIVLPDPRDYHPDHCATGLFVLEALRKLNQDGGISFSSTQILTYLVHFKDYPTSSEWTKEARKSGLFMSPTGCGILSSTEWLQLPLSDEDLEAKERALLAHQSQHQMLGGFFKVFLTPQEIFGVLDPAQVLAIPQEYALFFKQPNN
jgi:LmbE family N-acetylglucosaminyl deacetylase